MARLSRFRVIGDPRDLNGARAATITINREAGLISVRPYRQHRAYEWPLAAVARLIICKTIAAEVAERKKSKKKLYLVKRGGL